MVTLCLSDVELAPSWDSLPVCLVTLAGIVFLAGEDELKRGVDTLQGFVQLSHRADTVVIFPENVVDAIAEMQQQHKLPTPPSRASSSNSALALGEFSATKGKRHKASIFFTAWGMAANGEPAA